MAAASRSEFFSRAAARYLDELDAASVTNLIDEAVGDDDEIEDAAAAAALHGRGVLSAGSDEW